MTRAPKIWKKTFRIKKRINPRKAASVRMTRIRDPVKKSFIMWAICSLFSSGVWMRGLWIKS